MKNCGRLTGICPVWAAVVLIVVSAAWAKTPEQLKTEFAAMLGPGKFAKIVWSKGGRKDGFSSQIYTGLGENTKIMAMDTRYGVIRQLVPNQPDGRMIVPTFTWDGNRVIFYNIGTKSIHIANWDGSGHKVLKSGFRGSNCWQSSDGKHWMVGATATGTIKTYRVNIDQPAEQVELYSANTNWAGLSPDGKVLAAAFPDWPNAGLYNLETKRLLIMANVDSGGCWPSISRDDTHRLLYTIEPHTNIRIVDETGKRLLSQHVGTDLLTSALDPYREYNALRWTNDPDIITFWLDGASNRNPIVQRISTRKWVSLNDTTKVNEGATDAWIYSSTAVEPMSHVRGVHLGGGNADFGIHDFRGRAVTPAAASRPGVYLRGSVSRTGKVARIRNR